ncbi:MAG: peroxiredoxin [Halopseudomonas aestusnigri]
MTPNQIPNTVFHTRVRNEALDGPNPFEWKTVTSDDVFKGRNIVLFALPGAFTPACSDSHLPGFETLYDDFVAQGIDDVICLSVNDAFTMFQWGKLQGIEKVRMLPDGNGDFTKAMGMLVSRSNQGMGSRSWRYSMHVEKGEIQKIFAEDNFQDNPEGVPLQVSDADTILNYLKSR